MSIDQRIRDGIRRAGAELPESAPTERVLTNIAARAAAATRRRRVVGGIAAAAVVVLVAVLTVDADERSEPSPTRPSPTVIPPQPTDEATQPAPRLPRLTPGIYLSDQVTFADMATRLREYQDVGAARWIGPLRARWGDLDGRIELKVRDHTVTASIAGTDVTDTRQSALTSSGLRLWSPDHEALFDTTLSAAPEPAANRFLLRELMAPQTDGDPRRDPIPLDVVGLALFTTVPFTTTTTE